MPQTFSNDIDLVKYTEYIVPPSKTAKEPAPTPWPLPAFETLQVDDYNDPREPNIPPSLDQHDPLALFRLLFTNQMVDKIVEWTNKYVELHQPLKKKCPKGKERPWKPTLRRELYAYFAVVISMGITIEPIIEDY